MEREERERIVLHTREIDWCENRFTDVLSSAAAAKPAINLLSKSQTESHSRRRRKNKSLTLTHSLTPAAVIYPMRCPGVEKRWKRLEEPTANCGVVAQQEEVWFFSQIIIAFLTSSRSRKMIVGCTMWTDLLTKERVRLLH